MTNNPKYYFCLHWETCRQGCAFHCCKGEKAVQFSSSFLIVSQKNWSHATKIYSPSSEDSSLLHLFFDFRDFIHNSGILAVRTVPANIMVVQVETVFITNATVPKHGTFLNTKNQPWSRRRIWWSSATNSILKLPVFMRSGHMKIRLGRRRGN